MDALDLFERGTSWTAGKIPAAVAQLDASTPCEEWNVKALLNHLLDAQQQFAAVPGGRAPNFDGGPPDIAGDDPVSQYESARQATLDAYRPAGVVEKTMPMLAIGFVDQLVHGWDLAVATGQDATIPADLAEAAFGLIDGRMSDDQRGAFFKAAVPVPEDASPQDKLLAYGGRAPVWTRT
jgi:uncharacterized protein (TIGR03086 family)